MLKRKSWFLAQASAGASQTPRATFETSLIMYTLPRSKVAGMDKLSERNTLTRQRRQQSYLLAKHKFADVGPWNIDAAILWLIEFVHYSTPYLEKAGSS